MRRAAERHLAEHHVRLAYLFVYQKWNWITGALRLDEDHAISAALYGLVRAVHLFDPSRGCQFSTFAFLCMSQAVSDEWASFYYLAVRYGRMLTEVREGREPSVGWASFNAMVDRTRIMLHTKSLDATNTNREHGTHYSLKDLIADRHPTEPSIRPDEIQLLHRLLRRLSSRKRYIVKAVFGIKQPHQNMETIGRKLGISKQRVGQLYCDAMKELCNHAQGRTFRHTKGRANGKPKAAKKSKPANEVPPQPPVLCKLQALAGECINGQGVGNVYRPSWPVAPPCERRVRCV